MTLGGASPQERSAALTQAAETYLAAQRPANTRRTYVTAWRLWGTILPRSASRPWTAPRRDQTQATSVAGRPGQPVPSTCGPCRARARTPSPGLWDRTLLLVGFTIGARAAELAALTCQYLVEDLERGLVDRLRAECG